MPEKDSIKPTEVRCEALSGGERRIPVAQLTFRPSAYAVIRNGDRVLAVRGRWTRGFWWFPGGACELGESLADALAREVREEIGIGVHVGQLLDVREKFLYFDPEDAAWQVFAFFYACATTEVDLELDGSEIDEARWFSVHELNPEQFLTVARPLVTMLRDS